MHTLCWLGKDLSWNQLNPYTWVICLIPTVGIAIDFIWTTFNTKVSLWATCSYFHTNGSVQEWQYRFQLRSITFCYVAIELFRKQMLLVDSVHYFSQLMWVFGECISKFSVYAWTCLIGFLLLATVFYQGNMVWALGNIFITQNDDDSAFLMWHDSHHAREKCRWWASWVLFSAYFPLFFLYVIWIPLTCYGKIHPPPSTENERDNDTDRGTAHSEITMGSVVSNSLHVGGVP